MRLATFSVGSHQLYGAACEQGMISLSQTFPDWPTLRSAIAADGLDELVRAASERDATHFNGEFRWCIPVPDPEKIVCVGVNYPDRNAEYRDGTEAPAHMSLFPRFPRSFAGHLEPLCRPPESRQLDYEGEIAIVIGRGGRRIREVDALDHVAGLTLCNEGTIRDWTRHAKFNVTQGKNWDNSGSIGPWIVPFSSKEQLESIELQTRVNGELRQQDRIKRMMFPIERQIAYISTFTTLVPGDMIVTGTPTGAGIRLDPPRFLSPGDTVEVLADGIGRLINTVVDE